MKSHWGFISCLIVLSGVLALAGCCPVPPTQRFEQMTLEDGRAALKTRVAAWDQYRGRLSVKAESPKGSFFFKTAVVAVPPDRFRLDAFSSFGQMAGLLLLDTDRKAVLWSPSEKTLYTADKAQILLRHLLGTSVSVETLEYLLAGTLPPADLESAQFFIAKDGPRASIQDASGSREQTWDFQVSPFALKTVRLRDGKREVKVTYDPPVQPAAPGPPKKIRLSSTDWEMEITVEELQRLTTVSDDLFRPTIPGDQKTVVIQ